MGPAKADRAGLCWHRVPRSSPAVAAEMNVRWGCRITSETGTVASQRADGTPGAPPLSAPRAALPEAPAGGRRWRLPREFSEHVMQQVPMNGTVKSFHHWTLDDIPYDRLDPSDVHDDVALFQLLVASSFVEIDTPFYVQNLARLGHDDGPFAHWLLECWQPEEVRHGEALKRYVTTAWPEYDWQAAYDAFHTEYLPLCDEEVLQPTLGLEMISRCVVEVGTSTFYGMISSYTHDPVLKTLAGHIRADEVHHYQVFLDTYRRHRAAEGTGRLRALRAMLSRFVMVRDADAKVPYRHVPAGLPPGHPFRAVRFEALEPSFIAITRDHYPFVMASLMLLKPLRLIGSLRKPLVPLMAATGRWYFTRVGIQGFAHE